MIINLGWLKLEDPFFVFILAILIGSFLCWNIDRICTTIEGMKR